MGQLTRAEMERVIAEGGSVLHGGQHISQIKDLPTEADLAKGDPDKEQAAAGNLQAQIDALQAQLGALQTQNDQQTQELESLRVGELRDRAKAAGIANADELKKDELVAALSTPAPPAP